MAKEERGERHPSAAELEHFLLGEMSPRQAASVIAHLLRGCGGCRQQMAPLAAAMFATGPLAPDLAPSAHSQYDFPLFKALAEVSRYATGTGDAKIEAPENPAPVEPEVPSLEVPASEVPMREPRRRFETLLERCRALRYEDPEAMVLTASLAVTFAERTDAELAEPEEIADLRAQAWAELGNAHRVADELAAGESALARAMGFAAHGSGDPLLLARLMDLTASLYTDQRRFKEAHQLLDGVYEIYRRTGDPHAAGRALVSKGISLGYALESEEAVRLLAEGLRQIEPARDPKLVFAAVHGLLWCLLDCGRVTEVERLLEKVRNLYSAHGGRLGELRLQWLEGRIAETLGKPAEAERAFLHVRKGLEEAELPYDAALASLDLAVVWLQQGRTTEILEQITELLAIFRARNISREALGALLMVQDALRTDKATVALLRAVASELSRMERFPGRKSELTH